MFFTLQKWPQETYKGMKGLMTEPTDFDIFLFLSRSTTTLDSETLNSIHLLSLTTILNRSIQLTIAVTALSALLQLIGIYAKSFLKHTGDPRTHALLAFAQYPPYTLLHELMLLDYPVPVIPSGT